MMIMMVMAMVVMIKMSIHRTAPFLLLFLVRSMSAAVTARHGRQKDGLIRMRLISAEGGGDTIYYITYI